MHAPELNHPQYMPLTYEHSYNFHKVPTYQDKLNLILHLHLSIKRFLVGVFQFVHRCYWFKTSLSDRSGTSCSLPLLFCTYPTYLHKDAYSYLSGASSSLSFEYRLNCLSLWLQLEASFIWLWPVLLSPLKVDIICVWYWRLFTPAHFWWRIWALCLI